MLEGRIDTQGTIQELRDQGVLDSIAQDEAVQVAVQESDKTPLGEDSPDPRAQDLRAPRKLIEDEHREAGSVKWLIYKTYLEASLVQVRSVFYTYYSPFA